MAWMNDEEFDLHEDNRERAITARSARNRRGHTGKGGRVRMPSDSLTKKQREAMNGECKTYRMGAPMKWGEFVGMPEDLQVMYVKALRKKYNVPNKVLAEMFEISESQISRYFKSVGLTKQKGERSNWNAEEKKAFYDWIEKRGKKDIPSDELVAVNKDAEIQSYIENDLKLTGELAEKMTEDIKTVNAAIGQIDVVDQASEYTDCLIQCAVGIDGQVELEGYADDILRALNKMIGKGKVRLYADWEYIDEPSTTNTEFDLEKWTANLTVDKNEENKKLFRECIAVAQKALLNAERREKTGSKG